MDFEQRLERAIVRGRQLRENQGKQAAKQALTEEELRNTHSRCRLDLSEHIETCLRKLADHFPGFRFQSIVGEEGWGARVSRDDFSGRGGGVNQYSRLEMVIRPYSSAHIVELSAKATVRNKEIFNRSHFQFLDQADIETFCELIDVWVLEFAERYAASA